MISLQEILDKLSETANTPQLNHGWVFFHIASWTNASQVNVHSITLETTTIFGTVYRFSTEVEFKRYPLKMENFSILIHPNMLSIKTPIVSYDAILSRG